MSMLLYFELDTSREAHQTFREDDIRFMSKEILRELKEPRALVQGALDLANDGQPERGAEVLRVLLSMCKESTLEPNPKNPVTSLAIEVISHLVVFYHYAIIRISCSNQPTEAISITQHGEANLTLLAKAADLPRISQLTQEGQEEYVNYLASFGVNFGDVTKWESYYMEELVDPDKFV